MNKAEDLNANGKWNFLHDDLECDKCEDKDGAYNVNVFEGTINGREATRYSCSNIECDYEVIEYIDEKYVNQDGTVAEIKQDDIGKKILLSDGYSKRILKQDKKGLYIIKNSVKNYVEYHSPTNTYRITGEWDHK